jgi:hypothetical protein
MVSFSLESALGSDQWITESDSTGCRLPALSLTCPVRMTRLHD